jgi:uncharacterized membrane protein YbhN (UPF0104 family)
MSLKSMIWNGLLVAALCLAVFLLYRIFQQYSLDQIVQSVRSIPFSTFCTALLFAAASYLCLSCFDLLAIRSLGKSLPYSRIALTSFISLSLGHNIGFAGLSSGAFRYRFYSRWGLTAEDVAKIILFCGVTVGLGLITLGGLAMIVNPGDAGRLLRIDPASVRIFGLLALVVPGIPVRRRVMFATATMVAMVVAALTFVAANPFLTAHPEGPLPPSIAAIAR